jgi:hypothetical protein
MNEAYGAVETAAEQIISCVRRGEDEQITPEAFEKAWDFLKSIGQSPAGVDRNKRRASATGRANSSPAQTPPASRQGDGVRENDRSGEPQRPTWDE